VDSSVRSLPIHLQPGVLVRGPSARTGLTVWTRAVGLCASVCQASVAPSVRSCSALTLWIGTLTCNSLTCRTGPGPTSRCRYVSRAPGHRRRSGSRGPWPQPKHQGASLLRRTGRNLCSSESCLDFRITA
jgi:hypothetical protein